MGNLIIHLGPPKTATTSLQLYLQSLRLPRFQYMGVRQPRSELGEDSPAKILYDLCSTNEKKDSSIAKVREKLAASLKFDDVSLVSEEMFLVYNKNMPFSEKLEKLYKITSPFNPEIIFCVRNPADALPSFYQEIYDILPIEYQNDFSKFQLSPYADCYKYEYLVKKLKEIGFQNIRWFFFDKVVNKENTLSDLTGILGRDFDNNIILEKVNAGTVFSENKRVVKKNALIQNIRKFYDRLPVAMKGHHLFRSVYRLLGIKGSFFNKEVVIDSAIEASVRETFRSDLNFLESQSQ